jgi:hypothetical protein
MVADVTQILARRRVRDLNLESPPCDLRGRVLDLNEPSVRPRLTRDAEIDLLLRVLGTNVAGDMAAAFTERLLVLLGSRR